MGNKWRKLKLALGLDSCVHTPRAFDDSSAATASVSSGVSPTIISSTCNTSGYRPSIPTPLSYGYPNPLRLALLLPFEPLLIKFPFFIFYFILVNF